MDILIDENYKITSHDCHCVNLEKKMIHKVTKKEYWKAFAYYSDVTSAVKGLLKYKVKMSDATSIQQLIEEIKKFEKLIEEKLRTDHIQI